MAGFPGFDMSGFPGSAEMGWLKANTNLTWCGYYLAPAPSHGVSGWMGQRAALQAAGWGLAPLYVGQQIGGKHSSHDLSGPTGTANGQDAAKLMTSEGFAPGSTVYLDLEDGPPFVVPRTTYVAAWAGAVKQAGFGVGVYCSHTFAVDVNTLVPGARIWAFKVTTTDLHDVPGVNFPDLHPAGSGFTGAFAWQLGQNCRLGLTGAPVTAPIVDLDTAITADPGKP